MTPRGHPDGRGPDRSVGNARVAVFSPIGSFAESAAYVRQLRANGDGSTIALRLEVGPGELGPGIGSAPHGHVMVIGVAGLL